MRNARSALGFVAVAALMILFLASTRAPSADDDLQGQVTALVQRVSSLENQVTVLKTSVRSNHPDPAMEQAARASLSSIQTSIREGKIEVAQAKITGFMEEYSGTRMAQRVRSIGQELTVVGRPAPETWSIDYWFQGESEIDLHGAGPTLVVFWETWCPHCRREVPELDKLYAEYRDRGFQIVGVTRLTRSSTEETVRNFIEEHDLKFPVAKGSGQLAAHFGVSGVPAAAVVMDGEIVWRSHPAFLSPELIDRWLE